MYKIYRLIPALDGEDPFQISDYEELSDERDYSEVFYATPLAENYYLNFRLWATGLSNVPDYIVNPLSWPICSLRFSRVLCQNCFSDIQIHDVNVMVKNGRSISLKAVNLMKSFDCFNFEKSQFRLSDSPSGKKYVSAIHEWVFDAEKIPKTVSLFRIPTMRSAVFIRSPLAEILIDSGMSGLAFIDDVTLV